MIFSNTVSQHWATRVELKDTESFISKKWDDGFRISYMYYADDVYYILFEQFEKVCAQRYRYQLDFPEEEINKAYEEQLKINALFHDGSYWWLVTTEMEEVEEQYCERSVTFPKEKIEDAWKKGFTIGYIQFAQHYWIVVFNKLKEPAYGEEWKTSFKISERYLNTYLEKNRKVITNLTFGDGKWAYTFEENTAIVNQKILTSKDFPEKHIESYWERGYDIGPSYFAKGKWVFTFYQNINSIEADQYIENHKRKIILLDDKKEYDSLKKYFEQNLIGYETKDIVHYYMMAIAKEQDWGLLKDMVDYYNKHFKCDDYSFYLGFYYKSIRNYGKAIFLFGEHCETEKKEIFSILEQFKNLFKEKQYKKAISYYKKHLYYSDELKPRTISQRFLQCFIELKEYRVGIEEYEKLYERYNDFDDVYGAGAYLYYYVGKQENNQKYLDKALSMFKDVYYQSDKIKMIIQELEGESSTDSKDNDWKKRLAEKEKEKRKREQEDKFRKY